jgi:membrane protein YqaA with SNARE-associated domain
MPGWFFSAFRPLLSWWGAFFLSALDSSVLFVVPLANDALIVYLAARDREHFWLFPLTMTAGSLAGAAVTYWIGHKAGDAGLSRFIAARRLEQLRARVKKVGAATLAAGAIVPPPFPLTPLVLTSGALDVDRKRFFGVFGAMRLLRFSVEALLAHRYGERVLNILQSDAAKTTVMVVIVMMIAATAVSAVTLWRRTGRHRS